MSSTLLTPRFVLRLMDGRHQSLFCGLYADPEVMAWIAPPLALADAESAFHRVCRHNQLDTPGHRYWAIEGCDNGEHVGMASLARSDESAELGVMLRRSWWRAGVSTEAFTVLLGHAFGVMGLERVTAERSGDAHALVIDSLLGPFGFERVEPSPAAPSRASWLLPKARWLEGRQNGVTFPDGGKAAIVSP